MVIRGDIRGYEQTLPTHIASEMASTLRSDGEVKQAIYISVAAGVLVYTITRVLDYFVFHGKKR
jgi:hypothetical protein